MKWSYIRKAFGLGDAARVDPVEPNLRAIVASLDDDALSVFQFAIEICVQRTHFAIGLPHLVAALVEMSFPVREFMRESGVDPLAVARKTQVRLDCLANGNHDTPPLRPEFVQVLVEAANDGCGTIRSLDLLQTMLRVPETRLLAGELAEELTVLLDDFPSCDDASE